jgi:hypothetical protein
LAASARAKLELCRRFALSVVAKRRGGFLSLLNGVATPPGHGLVLEVHLDIMQAPAPFFERLGQLGFEDDPFLDFYPAGFHFHLTGRTRVKPDQLHEALPGIQALIAQVLNEARHSSVRMYAECELVRQIDHFTEASAPRGISALDHVFFGNTRTAGTAAADIHVEFRSGTLPKEVRDLLVDRNFYWVRTPASNTCPSEEIATVQTSAFMDARKVYDRFVAAPLPACTGIHLEQKIAMHRSFPDVPMPEVMDLLMA